LLAVAIACLCLVECRHLAASSVVCHLTEYSVGVRHAGQCGTSTSRCCHSRQRDELSDAAQALPSRRECCRANLGPALTLSRQAVGDSWNVLCRGDACRAVHVCRVCAATCLHGRAQFVRPPRAACAPYAAPISGTSHRRPHLSTAYPRSAHEHSRQRALSAI
jgi:hypothetical protein